MVFLSQMIFETLSNDIKERGIKTVEALQIMKLQQNLK